ncbi:hypothetical protein H4582DRAFT_1979281 [Lactarius indigo]|nr:hypothetical protein H4582DRAFT_1979281 [Lactarius indigo]
MTAPTQELPSWLSLSTSLATNAAGQPTATFTTLVYLPLTYYGPSIPLGTDGVWVYGGTTSPTLSSSTSSPTNSVSSSTSPTPATPSSTLATPSSTSTAPSTTSPTLPSTVTLPVPTTTLTTVPTSTSSSALPSSTSSSVPASGDLSSHSHRTGVIVGSVFGAVLGSLLLLFLFICFLRRRQRNQQQRNRRTDSPVGQVMWMWHDVHRNDYDQDADLDAQLRSPGEEGSPVVSGDERDAFLRRSEDPPDNSRNGEPTARLVDAPRSSQDSSGRPIGIALTAGAGAAMVPTPFGYKSSRPSDTSDRGRHIISHEKLAEVSASPQSPEEAELGPDAPLLPPPAFNLNVSHSSRKSLLPSERSMTPGNDPESAMLYTAQRVRVGKDGVPSSSSGTSWPEAIGIPSILRRSWLSPRTRSATPTPTTPSTKSSLLARQLTDNELEAGRSLNAQLRAEMGYRDGARPVSGVSGLSTGSARSGNTVFYDAQSREEVSFTPPPVPPLPQGTASTGRSAPAAPSPLSGEPMRAHEENEQPPAYEPTPPGSNKKDEATDYLDAPVPRPASPFASVSSAKGLSPPPGLTLPNPHVWRDSATSPSTNTSGGIDIDLLEEAPPAAGASWRQMAQGLPSLHDRRTTFGLPLIHPRDPTTSEQGSLHSMRSHLSPHSALSAAGSAPVSNSASEHSRGFTLSSLKSLAHSSSVSSTDRRFARPSPGEVSPALSAMGRQQQYQHQRRSHRVAVPPVQPPPSLVQSATVTSTTMTTTTTRSSVTTHTSVTDPVTGEVTRVAHAAWTGGRERESAVPEADLGTWGEEGWSSPSHLRILQNRIAGRDGASHA